MSAPPQFICAHIEHQVLAFRRGDLLFVFNFHPTTSHADYAIPIGTPGDWLLALDSDAERFAGHARVEAEQRFVPSDGRIRTYLPTRTALILRLDL